MSTPFKTTVLFLEFPGSSSKPCVLIASIVLIQSQYNVNHYLLIVLSFVKFYHTFCVMR